MDKPISLLNQATVLTDADVLPIVNSAETKKVTVNTLKTNIRTGMALTTYVDSQDLLKVDKVVGKGLSTEDFTSAEKTKLGTVATGAEVNVNADWNAVSGDAQILNKPTIPSSTTFIPYTGAVQNADLGEFQIKVGQIELDQTPTGTAGVGITRWNTSLGMSETTLLGGSAVLKNGSDLLCRIVNKTGTNLTKAGYQAVRISGAQGGRLAVELAQGDSDLNSADTIGLAFENITNNQEGYLINVGQIINVNTTGSLQSETWLNGDVLYLSPTTAGRITNIKPTGITGHIVVLGYVEYSHANNGSIYVKIMNGWELDELHNVYINTPLDNQALVYDSANSVWENKTVLNTDLNNRRIGYTIYDEFVGTLTNGTFTRNVISTGTIASSTGDIDENHFGVVLVNSSITANSGVSIFNNAGGAVMLLCKLTANLQCDLIFKTPSTINANTTIRFGFGVGSATVADVTSGVYIKIVSNSLIGQTVNASSFSSTSAYTITADTWYHQRVTVVSLSLIKFDLFLMDGTNVFSQTLASNIPTNIALNNFFIATNSGTVASSLAILDYIGVTFPPMIRGALT